MGESLDQDVTDETKTSPLQNARAYVDKAVGEGLIPGNTNLIVINETQLGEYSAVFQVDTPDQRYIVKMRDDEEGLPAEIKALQKWSGLGVKVPKQIAYREPDDEVPVAISIMEYVDANPLDENMSVEEMVANSKFRELGQILSKMHEVKGEGFGVLKETEGVEGVYELLHEDISQSVITRAKIQKLIDSKYLTESDLKLAEEALVTLQKDLDEGTKPALTHNDFRTFNILDTDPLTIIDPDPRVTHPVLDLANSIVVLLAHGEFEAASQFINGYTQNSPVKSNVLDSALTLIAMKKIWTRYKNGNFDSIEGLVEILRSHDEVSEK